MEKAFFASREFIIGATVAAFLVAGGVVAYSATENGLLFDSTSGGDGCNVQNPGGSSMQGETEDTGVQERIGRAERTVTFRVDGAGLSAGDLRVCTDVGDLKIEPTDGSTVEVVFHMTIDRRYAEALSDTVVEGAFGNDAGTLDVSAEIPKRGQVGSFGNRNGPSIDVTVRLPALGPWNALASTDVGDVEIGGILLSTGRIGTDVGDIELSRLDVGGDLHVSSDVGDLDVQLASVGTGTLTVRTDVGDIAVRLPGRPDTGYDVRGHSDVGRVRINIGPTELVERNDDEYGPGESAHMRTRDYDSMPVRLKVTSSADVGNIDINVE